MPRSRSIGLWVALALVCGLPIAFYLAYINFAADISTLLGLKANEASPTLDASVRGYEAQTGSIYLPLPKNPFQPPIVRELITPSFANARSVWAATGRDDYGGIWVGVSASQKGMSAHLMHYDPVLDTWHDRGNVVDQLRAAGLHREGEGQVKIHSKIIPANDGWLYFASMDEEDEKAATNTLPRWGGHLCPIHPRTYQWQHLMATPEALVAAAGVGRYMYALGYWGHVLYQYDTSTRTTKRIVVGSTGGHISRNFIVDARGHAYVPRLIAQADGKVQTELVEYDVNLREVAATALKFYSGPESVGRYHGIIGLTYLADGQMLFTTHVGQLYSIAPQPGGPSVVTAVGWFHPAGESYAPSLFSSADKVCLRGLRSVRVVTNGWCSIWHRVSLLRSRWISKACRMCCCTGPSPATMRAASTLADGRPRRQALRVRWCCRSRRRSSERRPGIGYARRNGTK
ncbi:MAG: hypothetical protein V4637_04835 [Pseudomonadota bacterium]